jgi:hypothetical protein
MKDRQSNDPSQAIKSPVKKTAQPLVLQGEDTLIGEQVVFRAFDLRLQFHRFSAGRSLHYFQARG